MERRGFVRMTVVATVTGLAGCLGRFGGSNGDGGGGDDGGDGNGRSLDDYPCPDLDDVETVCQRSLSPDAEIYFESSEQSLDLPKGTIEFTLSNNSEDEVHTNFYDWRLFKNHEEDWVHLSPIAIPEPLMTMKPGSFHKWSMTIDNTDLREYSGPNIDTTDLRLGGLGPGVYAFSSSPTGIGDGKATRYIGLFRLRGEELDLVPTKHVVRTEKEGDTLVVYSEENETKYPATLVVTKLGENDADVPEFILEEVMQNQGLRNTLSYFENNPNIRKVKLRTDETVTDGLLVGTEGVSFRYMNTTYRAEKEN